MCVSHSPWLPPAPGMVLSSLLAGSQKLIYLFMKRFIVKYLWSHRRSQRCTGRSYALFSQFPPTVTSLCVTRRQYRHQETDAHTVDRARSDCTGFPWARGRVCVRIALGVRSPVIATTIKVLLCQASPCSPFITTAAAPQPQPLANTNLFTSLIMLFHGRLMNGIMQYIP